MVTIDLLDKQTYWPRYFRELVLYLKKQAAEDGIDDLAFPAWLEEQGIKAEGRFIYVDESLISFSDLKFKSFKA